MNRLFHSFIYLMNSKILMQFTFKIDFLPLLFIHELNPWEKTHQLRQDLFTFQSDLLLDAVAHRPIKEEKLVNAEKTRNLYRHILWNDFDRYVQFLLFFTCMIKIDKRIQATIINPTRINQGFLFDAMWLGYLFSEKSTNAGSNSFNNFQFTQRMRITAIYTNCFKIRNYISFCLKIGDNISNLIRSHPIWFYKATKWFSLKQVHT